MIKLNNSSTDGITSVRFAPNSDHIIVSSWDSNIYIYKIDNNDFIQTYKSRGPVLCCDFISDVATCSGGLDCDVKYYDLMNMKEYILGNHTSAVSCIKHFKASNTIVSGSWDGCISIWDSVNTPYGTPVQHISTKETISPKSKIRSLDTYGDNYIIVALNTQQIVEYDTRQFSKPIKILDSKLQYGLRSIRYFPGGIGYIVSSIEGRVSVEKFNKETTSADLSYRFKCHRKKVLGVETVFSVNAVDVHPTQPYMVTGGSDKTVCFWNYNTKKRITFESDFPSSISALSFNNKGTKLAIASSSLYESGIKEDTENALYIKDVDGMEIG